MLFGPQKCVRAPVLLLLRRPRGYETEMRTSRVAVATYGEIITTILQGC